MHDCRPIMGQRRSDLRLDAVRHIDGERSRTERCAPLREVRVAQPRARDAAWITLLLVQPDRAVGAVVGDEHLGLRAVLDGSGHFVAGHHHAAVTDQRHHLPTREAQRPGERTGHAHAHRAGHRAGHPALIAEHEVALRPGVEVAGIDHQHAVVMHLPLERGDHMTKGHAIGRHRRIEAADLPQVGLQRLDPGLARIGLRRQVPGQRLEETDRIGDAAQLRLVDARRDLGIRIHMHHRLLRDRRARKGEALGRHVAQVGADREQEVGALEHGDLLGRDLEAELCGEQAVGIREDVLLPELDHHRHPEAACHRGKGRAAARRVEQVAGDQQRALRGSQLRGHRTHGRIVDRQAGASSRRTVERCSLALEHILGNRDHHRPRAARGRDVDRARDSLEQLRRIVHLRHPFREVAEGLPVVDLLEGMAPELVARHLAADHHQRQCIVHRRVDRDRTVGRTRPAAHQEQPRPARRLRIGQRSEAGARLVATDHQFDRRIDQRIEQRQVALARHAEGTVDAARSQQFDQRAGDGE